MLGTVFYTTGTSESLTLQDGKDVLMLLITSYPCIYLLYDQAWEL